MTTKKKMAFYGFMMIFALVGIWWFATKTTDEIFVIEDCNFVEPNDTTAYSIKLLPDEHDSVYYNMYLVGDDDERYSRKDLLQQARGIEEFTKWRGNPVPLDEANMEFILDELDKPKSERIDWKYVMKLVDKWKSENSL